MRELAAQMVQGKVSLAVAAEIDDPQNPLGTDAMQIYEAIACRKSNTTYLQADACRQSPLFDC